jgi:hypothetical protein
MNPWLIPGINARLIELHADSTLLFRDIASRLNAEFGTQLNRYACIGRAGRLKLEKRPSPIQPKQAPVEPAPIAAVISGPVTLLELRDFRNCHYPLGEAEDRPPYLYCGQPAHDGTPWCEQHYRIVYARWK